MCSIKYIITNYFIQMHIPLVCDFSLKLHRVKAPTHNELNTLVHTLSHRCPTGAQGLHAANLAGARESGRHQQLVAQLASSEPPASDLAAKPTLNFGNLSYPECDNCDLNGKKGKRFRDWCLA